MHDPDHLANLSRLLLQQFGELNHRLVVMTTSVKDLSLGFSELSHKLREGKLRFLRERERSKPLWRIE